MDLLPGPAGCFGETSGARVLLVLLPTFGHGRLLLLSKGFIAAVTSLNVTRSNANFIPVLHLSLPVLSVFLQPVSVLQNQECLQ